MAIPEGEVAEGVWSVLYFGDNSAVEFHGRDGHPSRRGMDGTQETNIGFSMKNWKQMAEAGGLDIPEIERIVPPLDALEAAFRPLVKAISHDVEPALIFRAAAEDLPEEQS
jgi:hypothetical protein